MPRFLFTFLLIFLAAFVLLARTVIYTSPQSVANLIIFFASLFLLIASSTSILVYLLLIFAIPDANLRRQIFRQNLHWPFWISLGVCSGLGLKVLGAFNLINLLLLVAFLTLLFLYSSR